MLRLLAAIAGLCAAFAVAAQQVELKTSAGIIVLELHPDRAPQTVANFLQYAKDGFFDGTIFHRVIAGFMIQGGGYTADFKQKPTRPPIRNEAESGLRNAVGTVAMARTAAPHSATAQFFINVADNRDLDFRFPTEQGYGYCVFGKVVKGMDVVQRISKTPTGPGPARHQDVPRKPIVIERVRVRDGTSRPAASKTRR
jgi:cyclophilin family peptidyl-prolyl cis-trans isomerase